MNLPQAESNTSSSPSLRLAGECGYEVQKDRIVINIGEIANHRDAGNISGTLAIELWALEQPYAGGGFNGTALCGTSIGEINGQRFLSGCRYDLIFRGPPAGRWYLALMLREWTDAGYITRDYVNFSLPYVVESKPAVVHSETDNVINVEFASNKPSPAMKAESQATAQAGEVSSSKTHHRSEKDAQRDAAVSLNAASYEEIAGLKGISKKVAENIVAARPFESLDEMLRVKGIGAKLLQKIRHFIKV
jgi:competence ComEA-like helix-hairpin-helix protein